MSEWTEGGEWTKGVVRLPGGRVAHAAMLRDTESNKTGGTVVVRMCDMGLGYWWADEYAERLNLILASDTPVTCKRCLRAVETEDATP